MSDKKQPLYTTHLPFTLREKITYGCLRILFGILGRLPFGFLYLLSDILAWLADDVAHYRRATVEANLLSSFPEKSRQEIKSIRKKFYRFLTDYFLETVKMGHMSPKEMERRMRFENLEEVSDLLRGGLSVSLLLAHYCNWEWVSSLPLHFPKEAECGQIYHILHNRAADRIFLRLRSHFNAVSIPMADTLRQLLRWRREGKASVTGYIADQAPKPQATHYWLQFLNHDTPVIDGPERISRKLHCAVYYIDMRRDRRGYYTGRFVEITPDAALEPEQGVTEKYFSMLEATIRRDPAYWLWSHKRWKHSR